VPIIKSVIIIIIINNNKTYYIIYKQTYAKKYMDDENLIPKEQKGC